MKFLRRPVVHSRYAADYLCFGHRAGRLLSAVTGRGDASAPFLVVGIHGYIPCVKIEAILSKALQVHGFDPVILVNHGGWALRYWQLCGFRKFMYWEDWMRAAAAVDPHELRSLTELTFRELLDYRWQGVDIGRHVLSSVCRAVYRGKIDPRAPEVRPLLERLLPESFGAVRAAQALLDQVRPALVLFAERGYTPFGEISDVALQRDCNVVQWDISWRDDAINFKRYTYETRWAHPYSLSPESWQAVCRTPWTAAHDRWLGRTMEESYASGNWFSFQRLQHGKRVKSPEEVVGELGLDPRKRIAVIFPPVLWDASFSWGEGLFDDYEDWLVETLRVAAENTAVNWIVKLHPVTLWRAEVEGYRGELSETAVIRRRLGELPAHIKLVPPDTDINTYSFFQVADFCVTVRGTIGLEMASFGIPVLTAGTGHYSGLGFTVDPSDRENYLAGISDIQDLPPVTPEQRELAKKYIHAFIRLRPLRFTSFHPVFSRARTAFHPLNGTIQLSVKSAREFVEAADLRAFAEWAADGKKLDFLVPITSGDAVAAVPVRFGSS